MDLETSLSNSRIKYWFIFRFRILREWLQFYDRNFSAPTPRHFKMQTLLRFSIVQGGWVETGTYMGDTTIFLAKRFPAIVSIEPSTELFGFAKSRVGRFKNVELLHGTSEEFFEDAILSIAPKANVWLDGHFSGGITFQGVNLSPVEKELDSVARNLDHFNELVLFIDDVRLFPRTDDDVTGYPKFQWLINWCATYGFRWQVQNDILIAEMSRRSRPDNS